MVTRIKRAITVRGDDREGNLGLVHIYTGDGKGKTTASLGLAMRALGNGFKVYMIQFLKSGFSGELKTAEQLSSSLSIEQYGVDALRERIQLQESGMQQGTKFIFQPDDIEKEAALQGMEIAKKVIGEGSHQLVILDEINCVIDKGMIPMDSVIELIKSHGNVELVFTGRDCPPALFQYADYVSDMRGIKHPWQKGIKARKGIEY